MKKHLTTICLWLLAALLLCGCAAETDGTAEGTIVFTPEKVTTTGRAIFMDDDGDVEIKAGGTYRVSGTSPMGRVVVKAPADEAVTLILDGLDLTCPDDEVIYVKTAAAATVVVDGAAVLTSGTAPAEGEELSAEATGAALRAKCPLTLAGAGTLTVNGYINNGIAAETLTVQDGDITVTAVNNGVKADTDILVLGGRFDIRTDMDAIQAGGDLTISAGDFNIFTGVGADDADMKTGDSIMMANGGPGGQRGASDEMQSAWRRLGRGDYTAALQALGEESRSEFVEALRAAGADDVAQAIEDDNVEALEAALEGVDVTQLRALVDASGPDNADDGAGAKPNDAGENDTASGEAGGMRMPWDKDNTDTGSRKGLKAGGAITINGGTFVISTEDDAIHGGGDVTINGGSITARAGDDGIHSDTSLAINGGSVDLTLCFEGLEAPSILITGGYTNVVAKDDGMNANGGSFRPPFASNEASDEAEDDKPNPEVRITGGIVLVDSGGDGLDSNGSMYIEGGQVYVSGPSTNWDAAIDYGDGSSEFVISGGLLMAAGYSGMAEAPDSADGAQPSIYYAQSEYCPDGAAVTLTDDTGRVLAEYAFAHSFNCVIVSTPEMQVGRTYTLTMGGTPTTIELTDVNFSNRMRGGPGGMGGPSGEASSEASGEADADTGAGRAASETAAASGEAVTAAS